MLHTDADDWPSMQPTPPPRWLMIVFWLAVMIALGL